MQPTSGASVRREPARPRRLVLMRLQESEEQEGLGFILTEDSRHPRVELVNKAAAFEVPDVDGA